MKKKIENKNPYIYAFFDMGLVRTMFGRQYVKSLSTGTRNKSYLYIILEYNELRYKHGLDIKENHGTQNDLGQVRTKFMRLLAKYLTTIKHYFEENLPNFLI